MSERNLDTERQFLEKEHAVKSDGAFIYKSENGAETIQLDNYLADYKEWLIENNTVCIPSQGKQIIAFSCDCLGIDCEEVNLDIIPSIGDVFWIFDLWGDDILDKINRYRLAKQESPLNDDVLIKVIERLVHRPKTTPYYDLTCELITSSL